MILSQVVFLVCRETLIAENIAQMARRFYIVKALLNTLVRQKYFVFCEKRLMALPALRQRRNIRTHNF